MRYLHRGHSPATDLRGKTDTKVQWTPSHTRRIVMSWKCPGKGVPWSVHWYVSLMTMSLSANHCPTSLANLALQPVHSHPRQSSLRPTASTRPVALSSTSPCPE